MTPFLGYAEPIDGHPEPLGDAREERLAKNEVLFRTVNESIEQQAIRLGGDHEYEFICECASSTCLERVPLTLSEYEHVRAEATRFFVRPGHANIEVELVVERAARYDIVEKDGAAGIVAEHHDPRDADPIRA